MEKQLTALIIMISLHIGKFRKDLRGLGESGIQGGKGVRVRVG